MIRVALKGLATRKLRTALTAIAIVLGVALVAGTFVLTDSITGAFDSIFTDGLPRDRRDGHGQARRHRRNEGGSGDGQPPFAESLLAQVRALPDVKDAVGDDRRAAAARQEREGDLVRRRPEPRVQRRPHAPQFNSLTLVEGRTGRRPSEVVIDTSTARRSTCASGDTIGVQAGGPVEPLQDLGPRQVRLAYRRSAAPRWPASTSRPPSDCSTARASSTDPRRSAKPASPPEQLVTQIRRVLPARHAGADRSPAGPAGRPTTRTLPHVPSRRSCSRSRGWRCSSALRHRQHALDHDRPAHARVRHAAHARRLAPAGLLDPRRGARRSG